jgi:molybdate transport system substrate-binding protein
MTTETSGITLKIMSGLAVRGAFEGGIVSNYEARTGNRVDVEWTPTTLIMSRLAAGVQVDIVLLARESMDGLVEQGKADPATRVEVADSRLGLAVAKGAVHPRIGTVEQLRQALAQARSMAYSRAGASGIYFEKLIEQLGIAETVRAKATVIPSGFTAEKLVSGEADMAVQQLSELMVVPGVEVVGKLPEEVQQITSFSAAIMPGSTKRVAAEAFLAGLKTDLARAAYIASGVDPV